MNSDHGRSCPIGLAIMLAALGCEAASGEITGAQPPVPQVTVDAEGDEITNQLARVEIGTNVVYFAEPEPGSIVIGEKWKAQRLLDPESTPTDLRRLWRALTADQALPATLAQAIDRQAARGGLPADDPARDEDREALLASKVEERRARDPDIQEDAVPCDIAEFYKAFCANWGIRPNKAEACDLFVNPIFRDRTFVHASDVNYAFAGTCSETAGYGWTPQFKKALTWSNVANVFVDPGEFHQAIKRSVVFDFQYRIRLVNNNGGKYHMMYYVSSEPSDERGKGFYNMPISDIQPQ
jgi:hypothetical protein